MKLKLLINLSESMDFAKLIIKSSYFNDPAHLT